ncbi:MAG TPA: cadmium resistance transporter [Nitrososphaeraceae archaeon]|nr:cadmium resistance transporter [Nitrososphaeraceae archaeon]
MGQYIGIGLLVAISIIASFISLVIPLFIIGYRGIIPIIMGIKKLLDYYKNKKSKVIQIDQKNKLINSNSCYHLSVAAITFSNGRNI